MPTDQAKDVILALRKTIKNSNQSNFITKLNEKQKQLTKKTESNPVARNAISYILHDIKNTATKDDMLRRTDMALDHLYSTNNKIAELGHIKIKKGMVVFVHGYSSSIVDLLVKAKKQGINFEVFNTEAKPYVDGRAMASQLSKHKIPVKHFSDMALRQALKKADIVLMGANVISSGKIYCKIGSELVASLAEKYDVPVYVCADTWKFDDNVAKEYDKNNKLRPQEELWSKAPRGVTVINFGFEKIDNKLVTGMITESGIYKPHYLILELKRQNKWM